jgi:VWFA-related protein
MTRRLTLRLVRAVLACIAGGGVMLAQQQATFRVRRDVVRVDVLVTERGRPVKGLTAADLQVLDNGIAQEIDSVSTDDAQVNAVMALDVSGSVAGDRLDHLRGASRALIKALKKDDRSALISFSHIVELGAALTPDPGVVLGFLDRIHAGGGTALQDAAYAGLVLGESDAGRSLLIVFSDGFDTSSWLTPEAVLDIGKRSEAVVYGVSVRKPNPALELSGQVNVPVNRRDMFATNARMRAEALYGAKVEESKPIFLRDLSAATGGSLFEVESTKNLDALFVGVLDEFRQRYLVSYSPKGGLTPGWHKIEVRVKSRPGLVVKARPGYQAG